MRLLPTSRLKFGAFNNLKAKELIDFLTRESEAGKTEDEKKVLQNKISDLETAMYDSKDKHKQLNVEIVDRGDQGEHCNSHR